jgi:hypothetical protein
MSKPGGVFLNDLNGIICAAAVENDVLYVRVALEKHRANSAFDELPLIIRRCDHTDGWPWRAGRVCIRQSLALYRPRPTSPARRGVGKFIQFRTAHAEHQGVKAEWAERKLEEGVQSANEGMLREGHSAVIDTMPLLSEFRLETDGWPESRTVAWLD